jgi:RNA recognition motif-containing protein
LCLFLKKCGFLKISKAFIVTWYVLACFFTFQLDVYFFVQGKKVTCKKAEAKPGKIYVGRLPATGLTTEEVQTHFNQFGTVTEVIRPVDKTNNDEPKNFAFITFEKEEVARQLVKEGTTNLNGHDLVIKKVVPKDSQGGFGGRGGARGGYGGGWGGYGDPYGMYGGGGYGDPYGMYGGYGGGYGGYGGPAGGKAPRGGPGTRGRGRSRPY